MKINKAIIKINSSRTITRTKIRDKIKRIIVKTMKK